MNRITCKVCGKSCKRIGHNHKYCKGCKKLAYKEVSRKATKRWRNSDRGKYNERRRKYYDYRNNKERRQKEAREYDQRIKLKVFKAYGGVKCSICGISDSDVLTIDHIKGGGNKHRKTLSSPSCFYNWLVKNNYPIGFRVLCRNCNWKEHLIILKEKRNVQKDYLSDLQKKTETLVA